MAKFPFLSGGGQMGELIRAFDWSATPIGKVDSWEQPLRTVVATLLRSKIPMLLWWGPDLICIFNDPYLRSLHLQEKQTDILGSPARLAWPDLWDIIGPKIAYVFETGDGTWNEDLQMPIARNGIVENVYWTFGYNPVFTEEDEIGGILMTGMETTAKVKTQALLEEKARQLEVVIDSADLGFWDRDLVSGKLSYNSRLKEFFGFPVDSHPTGEDYLEKMNPDDRQRLLTAIAKSQQAGSAGEFDVEYTIPDPGSAEEKIVRAKGRTLFEASGVPIRFTGTLQDVTQKTWTLRDMEATQRQLLNLFEEAPVAISTMSADDNLRFLTANRFYGELVGRDPNDLIGKGLLEALPEIKGQGFDDLLKHVITSGTPYTAYEVPVQLARSNGLETVYVNFSYIPRWDAEGRVKGILVTATDVTHQVRSRRAVEENEALFRSLIEAAPFPIGVYAGRELRIQHANPAIIEVYGKGPQVIGKNYLELLPELISQGIGQQLDEVFETGRPFFSDTRRVEIEEHGLARTYYFKYNFIPLFDAEGKVYGILNTGVDVTEMELARQRAQEAETALRSAVEVAELANWMIDVQKDVIHLSQRLREWTGISDAVVPLDHFLGHIPAHASSQTGAAYRKSLLAADDAPFDFEHPLLNPKNQQNFVVHVRGQLMLDAAGNADRLSGTMQDITAQRELQWELQKQVNERTKELAATNTALQKANYELERKNAALKYSNDELTQYAYVTSHDLQEPLRKVRFYISALSERFSLPDGSDRILQKITKSSARMSQLIQDLLSFSRLLGTNEIIQPVNLDKTVNAVLDDFELMIQEKSAVVQVDPLPIVPGIALQLNQLFHNLIGNALKFSAPGRVPQLYIRARLIPREQTGAVFPEADKPHYHEITVEDNGIGFEAEYRNYIFELFKQLHTRDAYPGSGIGLALCRRIANNHGGHTYATSVPGKGSTFYVLLPAGLPASLHK